MRSTHRKSHELSFKRSLNYSRHGLERDFREGPRDLIKKAREAPSTVTAHFRFPAVAVEISHPKICLACKALGEKQAVRADTAMAVTQKGYLLRREFVICAPIIDEDEIVPGAVHFRKSKHIRSLTYNESKRKLQLLLCSAPARAGRAKDSRTQGLKKNQQSRADLTRSCGASGQRADTFSRNLFRISGSL